MDLNPIKEVRIMEEENIEVFLEQSKQWASGTVSLDKVFTEAQARAYVKSKIEEENKTWQSDSQEFIDRMKDFFEEAYNVAF